MDLGVAVTVAEARECIERKLGFREDEEFGCWLWDMPASTGYGPYLAFYEAAFDEVPEGFEVFHICPNGHRGCVRPAHLDIAPPGSRVRTVPDPALQVEIRLEFARKIRDEREARRESRSQFGAELGVSPRTVESWESGHRTPDQETYKQLAKRFGWDGRARSYVVTLVVQEVVTARSAGEAARKVIGRIEKEGPGVKYAVYNVRTKR